MKIEDFKKNVNFRDLGGYKTKDGKTIKKGYFYRSGGLYLLNDEEREVFRGLGIKAILDLRSKKEWDANPDPIFDGTVRLEYSGKEFKGGDKIDFTPEGMMQTGEKAKRQFEMLTEYYKNVPYENEALTVFFKEVKKLNFPLLFHCFSGKDRTGITAMLILGLLGCDKETIVSDFMLSNVYHHDNIEQKVADMPEELKKYPECVELVKMTWGVNEKIINAVYDEVLNRYDSFDNYFIKEHGFTKEDIQNIKDLILE